MYQKWIELGLQKGIKALEVYSVKRTNLNLTMYQGSVDKCVKSEIESVRLKGVYRGKMGSVSVENLELTSIDKMLDELIANAKILSVSEPAILYKGAKKYPKVEEMKSDFDSVPLSDKIALIKKLEQLVLNGKYCSQVYSTVYNETQSVTRIVNSKGLDLTRSMSFGYVYAYGVFQKDGDIQTAFDIKIANNFRDFDVVKIAKTTIKKGIAKLGGTSLPSGAYPVVIENDAMAELLAAYTSIFSAEAAYRNLSPLKDKVNQKIALENITLLDDPLYKKAFFKIPFDDEGVPCKKKKLIDKGVFTGFINNLKSAKLLGQKPTGNGFSNGVDTTNLILEPGKLSKDELLAGINDGVYITDFAGLHSGVNTSSGDFSLQCNGFKIKDGKLDHPVKMIVLSGNFFSLLNNVEGLGKDIKVNDSGIGTPSVRVNGLMIGGQ